MSERQRVIVAAAPGYFAVVYDRPEDAPNNYVAASRMPVIAWAMLP